MERRDTRTSMRGAQFVDPSALARIRNLELLARTVVDGFINGLHRAPHLGLLAQSCRLCLWKASSGCSSYVLPVCCPAVGHRWTM